jgi:N-acetylglucosamine-6-phosphate deacetylase
MPDPLPSVASTQSAGQLTGHRWPDGQRLRLRWRQGVIVAAELLPASRKNQREPWLAPALADLQVNGFAGVDFQQDNPDAESLRRAARGLQQAGCGRFLLTLITDDFPRLLERWRQLASLREADPCLQEAIAGWHIEGPFLSAEPGYHGAHAPQWMRDPQSADLESMRAMAGDTPTLLTLAPERTGAQEFIRAATRLGWRISLGHTTASQAELTAAVASGATGFTHLGNACPQLLDRHDNILWRVLNTPGLVAGLIPDGIHVSPALFRLIHRCRRPAQIYYTTDAMAAAGAPPGRYRLGALELEAGPDHVVRQPGRQNFAGSALEPLAGLQQAARMLGKPWRKIWASGSVVPARFMGWSWQLRPGRAARFCAIHEDAEGGLESVRLHCPQPA